VRKTITVKISQLDQGYIITWKNEEWCFSEWEEAVEFLEGCFDEK